MKTIHVLKTMAMILCVLTACAPQAVAVPGGVTFVDQPQATKQVSIQVNATKQAQEECSQKTFMGELIKFLNSVLPNDHAEWRSGNGLTLVSTWWGSDVYRMYIPFTAFPTEFASLPGFTTPEAFFEALKWAGTKYSGDDKYLEVNIPRNESKLPDCPKK